MGGYDEALEILDSASKVVVRLGRGAVGFGDEIEEFLELVDGVAVVAPAVQGLIPFHHPRNMTVGGSKGSISGNFAMANADTLVVIGSRSVCQSDCSRTGYPNVRRVININTDIDDATHYVDTVALIGDGSRTIRELNERLRSRNPEQRFRFRHGYNRVKSSDGVGRGTRPSDSSIRCSSIRSGKRTS